MNNSVAFILLSLLTHTGLSQNNSDAEIIRSSITDPDIDPSVFTNAELISPHDRLSQFGDLKFSERRHNHQTKIDIRNNNFLRSNNPSLQAPGARMVRTGKILTFAGAAIYALTWGIILSDQDKYKGSGGGDFPLLILQGSGFYSMGAGITLWVIGGKKK